MSLSLRVLSRVTAPTPRPHQDDPWQARYHADLAAAFGAPADEELMRRGTNVSQTDLVDLLLEGDPARGFAPDLTMLAYTVPDMHLHRAVASYLNHRTGGNAQSFALSRQGACAPFTALRIAAAHEETGRPSRTLLAVVEQTTLPQPLPFGEDLTDSGVLIALSAAEASAGASGESPAARLGAVRTGGAADELADLLDETLSGATNPLVVSGPGIDADRVKSTAAGADHHATPPGSHCTAVWLALAEHWDTWASRHDAVVLTSGHGSEVCVAALHMPGNR
ncbi:hypothetical protein [Streptomyces sp. RerS4]|uniref:hypothetical protein n=1 Tax=Streptomyces sp. RerS4 TaxID=2942449 RepID=UPI00201C0914|nr:hypothetical protein [Streptomyces sp. RerS4]UQX03436.1 hypothetical protein M4D82_25330 [Streptomyces sp. RerS4]